MAVMLSKTPLMGTRGTILSARGLLEALEQEEMQRASVEGLTHFAVFCKLAWPTLLPGVPLVWNWHHDALCEHLQATQERAITRLLINIAPGHTKSSLVSVLFPLWCWLHEPFQRWLCGSNNLSLALRDNMESRRLIESEWFQACYGEHFKLVKDQNAKMFYANDRQGYRMAVGVSARTTGKRGTNLLLDDPHDAMEGEKERRSVIEWFANTWISRLNDYKTGVMIIVGQRIHYEDLTGHILATFDDWDHLNLPTEFETEYRCTTSLGWSDPRAEEGELLWPEKYPPETITALKRAMGSYLYSAQYQQRPVPASGGQFQKQWLRAFTEESGYYELERSAGPKRVLKSVCTLMITGDLAVSEKQSADYTVFAVWAITPERDLLLLDLFRDRIDNPTQQKTVHALYVRYQPASIVIESVAYQLAFIQQLRSQGLPVREYTPVRDKVSRAITAAVMYEAEKVFHNRALPNLADIEHELLMFPKAAHDDVVDVVSMACEQATVRSPSVRSFGARRGER